ncbi:MAG: PHP domain-containing protein [Promethearchaeota archaeon]|nr:MAG: PHP domain-containing protein [Candidatus Lokiarchaeota archaeon]
MNSIKLDLHVHTCYSGDSLIKPKDVVNYVKLKGLDGFAITDHQTLKGFKISNKIGRNKDIIVIPGMEINTHIGEIIILFIEDDIKFNDNNFNTIVEKVKDNNGLIVIPHPFDFLRDNRLKMNLLNDNIINKFIDGIEIINSRIIFKKCITKAKNFNKKYNLFETGGSDAHTLKEIGNGYTLIRDADKSFESIKNCLLEKKSRSMGMLSSPLVHVKTVFNKIKKGLYF